MSIREDVEEWLDPSEWDAENWPLSRAELEREIRTHWTTRDDGTDEAMVAAWMPIAVELWSGMTPPETESDRAMREAAEAAEDEDEQLYRRDVCLAAFGTTY